MLDYRDDPHLWALPTNQSGKWNVWYRPCAVLAKNPGWWCFKGAMGCHPPPPPPTHTQANILQFVYRLSSIIYLFIFLFITIGTREEMLECRFQHGRSKPHRLWVRRCQRYVLLWYHVLVPALAASSCLFYCSFDICWRHPDGSNTMAHAYYRIKNDVVWSN